jgi:Asp/Glu/hydantoin racemase
MSGKPRILVVNPNSSADVTAGIDAALDPLRFEGGPQIACATLAEGPPGIQTETHTVDVVAPLKALIAREDNRTDCFVIACFSDPGLYPAREDTRRPVIGIMNAGMTTALNLAGAVGVIAIQPTSIPRHTRSFRAMGVMERVAGERAVGLDVVDLADEGRTLGRMIETGRALKDEDGAGVVVMGCAGMARYRERMEDALGVPVVDPTQAAVAMAIGAVSLGWRTGA